MMNSMGEPDWTTGEPLSEGQIRERFETERWERVQPVDAPWVVVEENVSVPTPSLWEHSGAEIKDEDQHVRIPAA